MKNKLLRALYPQRCPYCDKVIYEDVAACNECSEHFPKRATIQLIYADEKNPVYCVSPFVYRGMVNRAILRFKFRDRKCYAENFSLSISREVNSYFSDVEIDFVTAVPMDRMKKLQRGYNQSEILAKAVARRLGVNYKSFLKKSKRNLDQHKLSVEQRAINVIGVYSPKNGDIIKGKNILICDDIVTTGSTLKECVKVLLSAGAKSIICATVAGSLPI